MLKAFYFVFLWLLNYFHYSFGLDNQKKQFLRFYVIPVSLYVSPAPPPPCVSNPNFYYLSNISLFHSKSMYLGGGVLANDTAHGDTPKKRRHETSQAQPDDVPVARTRHASAEIFGAWKRERKTEKAFFFLFQNCTWKYEKNKKLNFEIIFFIHAIFH